MRLKFSQRFVREEMIKWMGTHAPSQTSLLELVEHLRRLQFDARLYQHEDGRLSDDKIVVNGEIFDLIREPDTEKRKWHKRIIKVTP